MRMRSIVAVAVLALAAVVLLTRTPNGPIPAHSSERTVTLQYDAANGEVSTEFDTTHGGDAFVSVAGTATFPDGRSEPWGTHPIGPDPSGAAGHSTANDPTGTTYSLVVRFYDSQRNVLATFEPTPVSKVGRSRR